LVEDEEFMSDHSPKTVMFLDHTASLGGGEFALLHLVQRLDRSRYFPVVVLSEDGPLRAKLEASGVETRVIALSARIVGTRKGSLGIRSALKLSALLRVLAYCRRLARFIKARRVDIVHTNSLKADVIGGISARMAGVPVIWHVRDRIENDYLPAPAVRVFRWLCRTLPTHVITNSHATLRTLHLPTRHAATTIYSGVVGSSGAGGTSASVVHDGVVHDGVLEPDVSAPKLPNDSAIIGDSPIIGIIGRVTHWKGQHIFLQAAAKVRAEFPDVRFRIIGASLFGEHEYQKELETLVQKLELGDRVRFTGFVPDVADELRQLDILVHASITSEPFGLVVVEGMMAAKPVVATRGGGVLEIVEDGESGLLVPMGDADAMAAALRFLLQNPDRARQMGHSARRRVQQNFTIELTVQRVQTVYDDLWQRWISR